MEEQSEEKQVLICAECGKPIEDGDLEVRRLRGPNWKKQGYLSNPRNFHKSKRCAGTAQMCCEG